MDLQLTATSRIKYAGDIPISHCTIAVITRQSAGILFCTHVCNHKCREALLGDASRGPQARETARTAELDNAGLVQLQRDTMREQDESLERLEQSVMGTRVRMADIRNIADVHIVATPGLLSGGLTELGFKYSLLQGLRSASQGGCPHQIVLGCR